MQLLHGTPDTETLQRTLRPWHETQAMAERRRLALLGASEVLIAVRSDQIRLHIEKIPRLLEYNLTSLPHGEDEQSVAEVAGSNHTIDA